MRVVCQLLAAWYRLTAFVRRRRIERDIDDELAFHLSMRQAEHTRDGAPGDEAGLAVRRRFGNVTAITEETREMWTFPSFESFRQDVRFALRTLRKAPLFTFVAISALAIGIGANTAIFSLVDAMLIRGLPYPQADRLMVLIGNVQRAQVERRGNSYPDYLDWRREATRFEDMAAYQGTTLTLAGAGGDIDRVGAEAVSASYFAVLGVAPAHGRAFRPDEDEVAGRNPVVMLGDGLWRRRFGGDPTIVGRTIQVGTRAADVIGILPPGFRGLSGQADLFVPFVNAAGSLDDRGNRGFFAVARLKEGTSVAQAQAEMTAISGRLERAYPESNAQRGAEVSPLSFETFGQVQPAVLALMASVAFVLLIAIANVANLLISRSDVRQREIALRTALGAGRARLVRQLVTESCVLAALGALAGIGLATFALSSLSALPADTPPSFVQPAINLPVLLFTGGLTLGAGVLLGLAPAMHARADAIGGALKDHARGSSGASTRLRGVLVVSEVALAVVLLVGAGLMIRTVQNLTAVDPGYATENILTFNLSIPRQTTAAPPAPDAPPPPFVVGAGLLLDRLTALPGVSAAALSSDLPLGGSSAVFYSAEGDTTASAQTRPRAYVHRVTPDFFTVIDVSIGAGRAFENADLRADSTAVIVSEGVVRRFWPGQDAIGRRLKIGPPDSSAPWLSIVGVVPDLRYRGLPDNPTADPDLYLPYVDRAVQGVVLRTSVDPLSVLPAVRAAVREANPGIVVYGVAALGDTVRAQTTQSRFTAWLMGVFAGTALLLAVIGIYGVLSNVVAQRTREFGIRVALGAGRAQILGVVARYGLTLIGLGVAIGGVASFAVARLLEQLLFGVSAASASAASGLAIALLAGVALTACLVPAWRATRVDPVVALRND
jgi:putative ABC transport system permease protein